jgi:hypothetical protein
LRKSSRIGRERWRRCQPFHDPLLVADEEKDNSNKNKKGERGGEEEGSSFDNPEEQELFQLQHLESKL